MEIKPDHEVDGLGHMVLFINCIGLSNSIGDKQEYHCYILFSPIYPRL
jgi:hypothetical protein